MAEEKTGIPMTEVVNPRQQPTSNVIVRQGQVQPNDYLAFAILVTICCCCPFGIVAIMKSMEVRSRHAVGDQRGAEEASLSAKQWSIAGLICGIVIIVIGMVLNIITYSDETY